MSETNAERLRKRVELATSNPDPYRYHSIEPDLPRGCKPGYDAELDLRSADELERLTEDARKFYNADGTFELLDSAEEVTERRKKAAAEIERLTTSRDAALSREQEANRDWSSDAKKLHKELERLQGIVEKQEQEIEDLKYRWQSKVQDIQIAANDTAAEDYEKIEAVQVKEIERLHKIVGPVVDIADEINGKEWPVYEIQKTVSLLNTIVAKYPKTADHVSVYPEMPVFHINLGEGAVIFVGTGGAMAKFCDGTQTAIINCYSTYKAAIAAKAESKSEQQ